MDWYEHSCRKHGVIVRYRRDDPERPAIPITCPEDLYDNSLRCGERRWFRIVPSERTAHVEGPPPAEPDRAATPR
jgi:hypothetical protein